MSTHLKIVAAILGVDNSFGFNAIRLRPVLFLLVPCVSLDVVFCMLGYLDEDA